MKALARLFVVVACVALLWSREAVAADPPDDSPGDHIFDFTKPGSKLPNDAPSTHPTRNSPTDIPDAQPATAIIPTPIPAPAPQDAVTSPTAISKVPVPSPAALANATKMVDDVFADDIAKATTPEQKTALSAKLLQAGVDEKSDMANKYALFQSAKDFAVQAGDLIAASTAIGETAKAFDINSSLAQIDAETAIASSPHADRKKLADDAASLASDSLNANDYESAKTFDDLAITLARQSKNQQLLQSLSARSKQITQAQVAYLLVKSAEAVLTEKPDDPEANLKVGRFDCFVRGDWEAGLPHLSKGSDPALKALATSEMDGAADAAASNAVADGWWNFAEKQTGDPQLQIQYHAGQSYEKALPGLNGLARAMAKKRIADASVAGKQLAIASRKVDLLHGIDVSSQAVQGKWDTADNGIVSDTGQNTRLDFNYQPPLEYDYKIVFTKLSGNDGIDMILSVAGRQFCWTMGGWGNTVMGFGDVLGKGRNENPTTVHDHPIDNNHVYTCIVKVRAHEVSAFLDGEMVSHLNTSYTDLAWVSLLHRTDTIGVCTYESSYQISQAQITEISGPGKMVSSSDPVMSRVVAVFRYTPQGQRVRDVTLYSSGRFKAPGWNEDQTLWFLRGDAIVFRWDQWLDHCRLTSDRHSFRGQNQKGELIRGKLVSGGLTVDSTEASP
jgi:hypothetical protein